MGRGEGEEQLKDFSFLLSFAAIFNVHLQVHYTITILTSVAFLINIFSELNFFMY